MATTRRERERREERRGSSALAWAQKQSQGFGPQAVKLPDGVELFKLDREGIMVFDIMEFIAGANNPNADEGFPHFERQYAVHRIPRPDGKNDRACCLWETWKEPCPFCKWRNDRSRSATEADALRPQLRHLFPINDKPGKADNPIKVMDAVHYNRKLGFGEKLSGIIKLMGEDAACLANARGGLTVRAEVTDAKYGSVGSVLLVPRKYDYPDDIIDSVPCLDDCLVRPDVARIMEMLETGSVGEDGSEEDRREGSDGEVGGYSPPSTRAPSSKPVRVSEPPPRAKVDTKPPSSKNGDLSPRLEVGMYVTYQGLEHEVIKVLPDGTLNLMDEDQNVRKGVAVQKVKVVPTQEDRDEYDNPPDTPKPHQGRVAKAREVAPAGRVRGPDVEDEVSEVVVEDDFPSEDGEDDHPPRKARR